MAYIDIEKGRIYITYNHEHDRLIYDEMLPKCIYCLQPLWWDAEKAEHEDCKACECILSRNETPEQV